ncbi:MAG TPA: alpha/beta family hydrolase [Acidimicrobiales bacterium]|nr:alpha/beta family hydrolase [Acidimicrobiales bacterium]
MGLLLAPGASATSAQSALVAMDAATTALGATVSRMDFPYTLAGRRSPDREAVLLAAVEEAAKAVKVKPGRLALGGRSMGGRICSMAVAEGLPALALVLVSYPLHPPGRPDKLRTAHLPKLTVPCLFISGTRDAFGAPAELEAATALVPGPVTHVWLDGKDHSLRGCDERVAAEVAGWLVGVARS